MFDNWKDKFEDWSDRFEHNHHNHWEEEELDDGGMVRGITIGGLVALGAIAALIVLCCCRRRRQRGRVLSPPAAPVTAIVVTRSAPDPAPAPYPQQQYYNPQVPAPAQMPPYPTGGVVTQYPTAAGAPYPTGGTAPYPTGGVYPAGDAPYPTGGGLYPAQTDAPSAPAFHNLPPTYEQATAHDYSKHS